MTTIVSRQNPRYRELARLVGSSRERRKTARCVLEGEHLVAVYLDRVGVPEAIAASEDALSRPGVAALVARVPAARALVLPRALFDDLGPLPPDIGLIATAPAPRPARSLRGDRFLLVEAIQDPGNLGSMLRSAAAFGVAAAFLSKDCAFAWAPKVLRAGQGAHFQLAIHEDADLPSIARELRSDGVRVLATVASGGTPLDRAMLGARVAVVVGNEGAGLSETLRDAADETVTIPMPGGSESLNAAAAAAVALYEVVRRRVTAAGPR